MVINDVVLMSSVLGFATVSTLFSIDRVRKKLKYGSQNLQVALTCLSEMSTTFPGDKQQFLKHLQHT